MTQSKYDRLLITFALLIVTLAVLASQTNLLA